MKPWANFMWMRKRREMTNPLQGRQTLSSVVWRYPKLLYIKSICVLLVLAACQGETTLAEEEVDAPTIPTTLPKQPMPLDDLTAFANPDPAWTIAGAAFASTTGEGGIRREDGKGVLTVAGAKQVATGFPHGDLEMDLKFLLPRGGKAQLWLQGRYAIQLQDTWKTDDKHCGMLVGPTTVDDHLAPVNASRAPGLWQHLSFYFEAPRFDSNGVKLSKAKIHYLRLNGYTLFEEIELSGPSAGAMHADEVAEAALVFLSAGGEAAFKEINYKAYTLDQLQVSNIQYQIYHGSWDRLPQLDTMTASSSGTKEDFDVEVEGEVDKYAMSFSGQLEVPVTGQYLFETRIDDGGDLLIDGDLIVHNDGEPGMGTERGLVELTKGTHTIELTYYQDVWGKRLFVFYEGPSIKRQALGAKKTEASSGNQRKKLVINPTEGPELIRSFVNHKGEKRNFPISVGSPLGVHYTFDLEEGTLLHAWRGEFADVTNMWVGRGHSQLLIPGNASAQTSAGVTVAKMDDTRGAWPEGLSQGYSIDGYDLDADGYPVFQYQYDGLQLTDQTLPTSDGNVERTIQVKTGQPNASHHVRLAQGKIDVLESGWYRIDGAYYIDVEEAVVGGTNNDLLLVPLAGKEQVRYSLIW